MSARTGSTPSVFRAPHPQWGASAGRLHSSCIVLHAQRILQQPAAAGVDAHAATPIFHSPAYLTPALTKPAENPTASRSVWPAFSASIRPDSALAPKVQADGQARFGEAPGPLVTRRSSDSAACTEQLDEPPRSSRQPPRKNPCRGDRHQRGSGDFSCVMSCRIALSSLRSATSFFSRAFSSRNRLSSSACSGSRRPYRFFQRSSVCSPMPSLRHGSSAVAPCSTCLKAHDLPDRKAALLHEGSFAPDPSGSGSG